MEQAPALIRLVEEMAPLLRTGRFGRAVRSYEQVGSTNTLAARWAAEQAPEGAVVVAEYQSAGRGRMGRTWEATRGQNLTFSLILHPPLAPAHLGWVTLAASIAVAEAVERFATPLAAQIKWPNDVLLDGRKCCGMLLESSLNLSTSTPGPVILGIGLNVNQVAFPPELSASATSLLLETGRLTPRAPLLAELLRRLEARYDVLLQQGETRLKQAYETRLVGIGEPVTLRLSAGDGHVSGILQGVADTGGLLLQTDAGLQTFHAGEVTTHHGP